MTKDEDHKHAFLRHEQAAKAEHPASATVHTLQKSTHEMGRFQRETTSLGGDIEGEKLGAFLVTP